MEEIIEGNKLIAEFMGAVKSKIDNDTRLIRFNNSINGVFAFYPRELKYHSSWDWLMTVVERISEHHYHNFYGARGKTEDDGDWDDTAYLRTFGMRDLDGNYMVRFNASILCRAETLIKATWLAVIDFITCTIKTQNKTYGRDTE